MGTQLCLTTPSLTARHVHAGANPGAGSSSSSSSSCLESQETFGARRAPPSLRRPSSRADARNATLPPDKGTRRQNKRQPQCSTLATELPQRDTTRQEPPHNPRAQRLRRKTRPTLFGLLSLCSSSSKCCLSFVPFFWKFFYETLNVYSDCTRNPLSARLEVLRESAVLH